jgi:hypothetical protein
VLTKLTTVVSLLNKGFCLAVALGATKLITIIVTGVLLRSDLDVQQTSLNFYTLFKILYFTLCYWPVVSWSVHSLLINIISFLSSLFYSMSMVWPKILTIIFSFYFFLWATGCQHYKTFSCNTDVLGPVL